MNSTAPVLAFWLLATAALSTGCVSSRFQMANAKMPPAVLLNLPGDTTTPRTFVDTVIVFHGPGSWKRDAYWDEYVVSVENPGPQSVTLLSAELVNSTDTIVHPGEHWDLLESESRSWLDGNVVRQNLALGAGAVFVGAGALAVIPGVLAASLAMSGWAIGTGGYALIAMPIAAAALADTNMTHEKKVAEEFTRRRLEMPAPVGAHGSVHGSLFFRVTPSPQLLRLTFRENGVLKTSTIRLSVLADLHRKPGSHPTPEPVGEHLAPLPTPATS